MFLLRYDIHTLFPVVRISCNNICSVHPDADHSKLIVKQFNGEDMVIENVEKYDLIAANEIDGYNM